MKQTIETKQEMPLLTYAISKLNPDIFTHPAWVRFSSQEASNALAIVKELFDAADGLEEEDPSCTSQILLACAYYQNLAGENDLALATLDHILDLVEQEHFTPGLFWAHWGACAVCFQMEKYDLAVLHLDELEAALSQQNEWVLADFVNVIKQSLCQPEMVSTWKQTEPPNGSDSYDPFHFTYLWLQNWGADFLAQVPDSRSKWEYRYAPKFFIKWVLKLNGHTNRERQLSVWLSIRSLLRLQEYDRKSAPESGGEAVHQKAAESSPEPVPKERIPNPVVDNPVTEITSPKPKAHQKRKTTSRKKPDRVPLTVQMLGPFSLAIGEVSPKLPASRALSVFKYLLLHHKQGTPREVLMDLFWPDAGPESARNSLNVAMHNLRQALGSITKIPVICFEEGAYHLASSLEIWLDVEEFDHCIKEGRLLDAGNQPTAALAEYEIAVNLYRGDLLTDTPYEDWATIDRERLRISYLDMLDHLSQIYFSQERFTACISVCQLVLNYDLCREDVHCRLMRCYSHLGQTSLALRQYQICAEALQSELQVEPASETFQLHEKIRRHMSI
jgi:DNA-binding SARP family transcriptional activator